jgi:hypothetical protein
MKSSLLILLIIVLGTVTVGCGNSDAATEVANAPTPAAPASTTPATPAADASAQAAPSDSPDSNQGMVQLNAGEGSFK